MEVTESVPVESLLKGSAAKVLLHLLAHRGEKLSNSEIMRGSGVHDRNTFFAAKKQLVEYGLWENPYRFFHTVGGNTPTVWEIPPTVGGNTPTPVWETPTSQLEPPAETFTWPQVVASLDAEVVSATRDFLAEACGADRMDDSGEWNVRNSPKNARRAAQAKVLMDAFQARFNKPLTIDTARRWVQKSSDSAEEALDAIETAHMRKGGSLESPVGYIDAIIRKKGEEQGASRSVSVHSSESEDNYYRPPSPEYLAKIEKLRQRGLMVPDED